MEQFSSSSEEEEEEEVVALDSEVEEEEAEMKKKVEELAEMKKQVEELAAKIEKKKRNPKKQRLGSDFVEGQGLFSFKSASKGELTELLKTAKTQVQVAENQEVKFAAEKEDREAMVAAELRKAKEKAQRKERIEKEKVAEAQRKERIEKEKVEEAERRREMAFKQKKEADEMRVRELELAKTKADAERVETQRKERIEKERIEKEADEVRVREEKMKADAESVETARIEKEGGVASNEEAKKEEALLEEKMLEENLKYKYYREAKEGFLPYTGSATNEAIAGELTKFGKLDSWRTNKSNTCIWFSFKAEESLAKVVQSGINIGGEQLRVLKSRPSAFKDFFKMTLKMAPSHVNVDREIFKEFGKDVCI